ncbi:MAG: 16S rRNA (guanine(527)-N(7))-methyltransferase RsmG [Elainella sp. Prado103]|jgi:16S rRNA (guanine527-N7)-methyltransferase|nr:16S rRNA (guanine(527)-N(7))-methyltransferase RsmG [Elainella sp. Prado103]
MMPALSPLPNPIDIWQQTLNWQPAAAQQQQYQRLYEAIVAGNQQLNLTRIIDPQDFWEKHLWDSLRGVQPWLSDRRTALRLIDVGTGGGFPGLPVAIARPDWTITLLDSTRKKIVFLDTLVAELGLATVKTWVDRAEQAGHLPQHREVYDIAAIRAVATASVCAEYVLPLLKLGGSAVLYRGQWSDRETEALQVALDLLGGRIDHIDAFVTPLTANTRHCIYIQKVTCTPMEYPRPVGIPAQKPL